MPAVPCHDPLLLLHTLVSLWVIRILRNDELVRTDCGPHALKPWLSRRVSKPDCRGRMAEQARIFENEAYLASHPAVKDVMTNFLTAVLRDKPEDVFGFAKQHFSTLE